MYTLYHLVHRKCNFQYNDVNFLLFLATLPSGASIGSDKHTITYSGLKADTEYTLSVTSKAVDSASGSDFKLSPPDNKTARTLELREYHFPLFYSCCFIYLFKEVFIKVYR